MPSLYSEIKNPNHNNTISRRLMYIVIAVAAVLVLIFAGLFLHAQSQLNKIKKDATAQNSSSMQSTDEGKQLVDQVGKLIILPTDENPTIATVSDLNKLKDQPFFVNAKVGDKVLIYSKAQKAILFRPSENKIIELAPLSDTSPAPTTNAPANTTTNPAK